RPDQAMNLTGRNRQIHRVERVDAFEPHAQRASLERRGGHDARASAVARSGGVPSSRLIRRRRDGKSPDGRSTMISTSSAPNTMNRYSASLAPHSLAGG